MSNFNEEIYNLYKPFRNRLTKYNVIDSLYIIWGYSRNYIFDHTFPEDIAKPAGFNPFEPNKQNRKYRGLFDHELEYLLKEFIINCDSFETSKSFRQKGELSTLINYMRFTLNEEIDKKYTIQDNFLFEFNRMVHRQFIWQLNYSHKTIFRYFKIYSHDTLSKIILDKFQLTSHQLFLIGFFFFGWTARNFRCPLPFKSEAPVITGEMIAHFIQHFSISLDDAKSSLKEAQQINQNIFYTYNPLLAKPLILYKDSLLCPIPMLIFWQITWGLYYSVVNEAGFANAFGDSFQNYVGDILSKSIHSNKLKILPEEKFKSGKEEKRTTDWIVVDHESILFIECKTKRMTMLSKTELDIEKGLEKDLMKMASFVVQLYMTYVDYSNDLYPQIKFDKAKEFYPVVLTLEDWYVTINPKIMNMIKDFVIQLFKEKNLDTSLIDTYPYAIMSSDFFERDIQIMNSIGIKEYFKRIRSNTIHEVIDSFKFSNIHEGEFQKIFMDPLEPK